MEKSSVIPVMNARNIFGAEIQYFRTEPRYWKTLLQQFKDTGLRCVTTYVQWGTHLVGAPNEAHPAGILDFTGETDPKLNLLLFLDLVEELGLDLNFRCGPFCCNEMVHGGYPPWLVLGDPNLMVWNSQNRTTQGYWIGRQEGSQPSYLHPEYLAWCARWIREVDRIIVPHLRSNGGCITMVNLDNEVSYIVQDGMLSSDYNPVNVGRGGFYHQFLQEKYGHVSHVPYTGNVPFAGNSSKGNAVFKDNSFAVNTSTSVNPSTERTIEDIVPPRAVPDSMDDNAAWYLDWMNFKQWCMGRYLEALRRMHEENGVREVLFMTNFNPHLPEGIPTRMPEFEKATGGIVGYDFYRGTFLSYSGYQSMARVLKLMNASLAFTWSAEFMAGTWNKVLESRVSDDHMRFMARCALAHGCKALSWFMFHDRDCWGDSPVSSHGHRRPSWEVLRETIALCFEKINGWDSLKPLTDVAVLYDPVQHLHTGVGDPMPCNDQLVHVGTPSLAGIQAGVATREYIGLFRLLEHTGAQPGVVDLLAKPEILDSHQTAFLPGSPIMEQAVNQMLLQWVTAGGRLYVSGTLPGMDERGGSLCFLNLSPSCFSSTSSDALSGVVEIPVGKGILVWHPETLCAETDAEEDSLESLATLTHWLSQSGVTPHVRIKPEAQVSWVDWRKTGGGHQEYVQPRNLGSAILQQAPDGERILFVLNHYPDAVRFILHFQQAPTSLEDLDTGESHPVVNGTVTVDMDRKCASVFRVI